MAQHHGDTPASTGYHLHHAVVEEGSLAEVVDHQHVHVSCDVGSGRGHYTNADGAPGMLTSAEAQSSGAIGVHFPYGESTAVVESELLNEGLEVTSEDTRGG